MGLALVKNKTGRPVIVSGNVGSGRGSGEQRFAVIPPANEGEDTCWGGTNNSPAGYDTVADAINAYLHKKIPSSGDISDIDFFYQVQVNVPSGNEYPTGAAFKIAGDDKGSYHSTYSLTDDGDGGVDLGNWDSFKNTLLKLGSSFK
jgi:hypothetical protein